MTGAGVKRHREIRGEVRLDASKSGALQQWSASVGGLDRSLPAATAICRCQSRRKARRWSQNCWYPADSGLDPRDMRPIDQGPPSLTSITILSRALLLSSVAVLHSRCFVLAQVRILVSNKTFRYIYVLRDFESIFYWLER